VRSVIALIPSIVSEYASGSFWSVATALVWWWTVRAETWGTKKKLPKRKQAKAAAVSTSSSPAPSSTPAQSLAELEARTKAVDEDQTEARAWGFTGVPFDLCALPPPEMLDEHEEAKNEEEESEEKTQ
jgi:hypothetical protein